MKYRKKPVEVGAILNTGTWAPIIQFLDEVGAGRVPFGSMPKITRNEDGTLNIWTLEGVMRAEIGDWLICGTLGEFYPCKPEVFADVYEAVSS